MGANPRPFPLVTAIEGPAFSGKSSLVPKISRLLIGHGVSVITVPEYVVAAGGPGNVPPTPAMRDAEELKGLVELLHLDERRVRQALSEGAPPQVVILDRSFHSLLAHRYAISRMHYPSLYRNCLRLIQGASLVRPQMVFYLDADPALLAARQRTSGRGCAPIFANPTYNRFFREYFLNGDRMRPRRSAVRLDGSLSVPTLAGAVATALLATVTS